MCAPADRARAAIGAVRAAAAALALVAALAAGAARAQDQAAAARTQAWDALAARAEAALADDATPSAELERLREGLAQTRSQALEIERTISPNIAELKNRVEALGPPPAEGAEEAPEIAERRKALNDELAAAQVPVIEAHEAYQRANTLIDDIDRVVRGRFAAEIRSQGPSPLFPRNWISALEDIGTALADYRRDLGGAFASPAQRATILRRLPINLLLVVSGVAITFVLRRWLVGFVEDRLASATSRRSIAWLVALRNLGRLIVPAVGAGLIFAALNPYHLTAQAPRQPLFDLPTFILVLIWAGWLGASLFAPRLPAYRMIQVDDAHAWLGARLTFGLGGILALSILARDAVNALELRPATISVIYFPIILLGALALWRSAGLIEVVEGHLAPAAGAADQGSSFLGIRFLKLLATALRAVAVLAPLLSALGYFAAAKYLVFPAVLSLGLIGSCLVVFLLLSALAAFLLYPGDRGKEAGGGLVPVAIATLVVLGALPLFALIWGARTADLGEAWTLLMDGVTFGGIRISATVLLKFVAVFGIVVGAARLLQVVLRTTVLPRTRFDAGGRNAVLAGVGYAGFAVACIAAISAAGLDLSNVAIVAGALSVGIGFGLQNIVSNFVSGIILLVERPIKEGDWIEVGAFSGYVRGISVRSTEIETFDRASVILPNSDLIAGTVLNRTHKGMSGRLQVPVSVAYDADPKKVEEILLAIAEEHPLALEDPAPRVLFMNLSPDTMDFEIRCWLRDVNYSLSARSDMNYEIVDRLGKAGIRVTPYARDPRVPPEPAAPAVAPPPAAPAEAEERPRARKAGT
jgi:small-conductance mechanosensitive channel